MQLPDQPPHNQGKILDHAAGIGEVSEVELQRRARELAEIDGLEPNQVNAGHLQLARQELLGAAGADEPNDDAGLTADLINEDDVPGESGSTTNAAASGDEQTIGEALYGEGIAEADHDRMTESRKQERREQS